MMPPVVSVVIPSYNRAGCIGEAIDSVLAQTYPDYEIIVVDDGSTDETREVLARYGDRISYIYQENAGVSAARNRGIKEARGEWIAFLDSDDEWVPEKLKKQLQCLDRYPDACGVVCDSEIFADDAVKRLFELRRVASDGDPCQLESRPLIRVLDAQFCTPTWVFRKSAISMAGGFDESISLYEDIDFSARVALEGSWCVVNEPLVRVMRKSACNLSEQHVNDKLRTPRNLILIYRRLLDSPNLIARERQLLRKRLAAQHFSLGYEAMRSRSEPYLGHLWQSVSVNFSMKSLVKVVALSLLRANLYGAIISRGRRNRQGFRRSEVDQASTRA